LVRELESPLEEGKGHGIIGSAEFLERIKRQFLSDRPRSREIPALRRVVGQVEPERILEVVAKEFRTSKEQLLERRHRGVGRSVLMDLLYRCGGLNQPEIGAWMGLDYSSVSVSRKDGQVAEKIKRIKEKLIQE